MRLWTFREQIVLALIAEAGHRPGRMRPLVDDGYVRCTKCNLNFHITGRANTAENGGHWDQGRGIPPTPLFIVACRA